MNCREFLNEFEERVALSEAATLHVKDCAGCKKSSAVQARIWEMIDGLNPVGAPKDFDFRVKARIANGRPAEDFQPRFLPILRYVLPLSVIVLFVGLIAFNTLYFSNNPGDATLAGIQQNPSLDSLTGNKAAAVEPQSFNDSQPSANTSEVNASPLNIKKRPELLAIKTPQKEQEKIIPNKGKKVEGGSRVTAVTKAFILNPTGVSPDETKELPPVNNTTAAISIEQIAEFMGIEMVYENGKRKVKSVTSNSPADRAGVKVGDVIEELNGKKLSGEEIRFKSIEAKSLTVLRASERIEINLQN